MKSSIFLILMWCLGACSSSLLVPLTYNSLTDRSTTLISDNDSVSVTVRNIVRKGGYLVFDVEVNNRSDQPVEVIPDQISYYGSPGEFHPIDNSLDADAASLIYRNRFNYKEQAMRPNEVEAYFKQRLNAKQEIGIALLLVGAGLIIHDAVQDSKDVNKFEWMPSDAKKANTREVLTTASLVAIDVTNKSLGATSGNDVEELQYLPDELFPKKTIAPKDAFRGKVFFRKTENNPYYRMIIPIGNTDYVFDLRKPTSDEKLKLRAARQW